MFHGWPESTGAPLAPPRALTLLDGMEEFPAVSADGQRLAFTWERDDSPARILIGPLDGHAPAEPLDLGHNAVARPVFSPDGQQLAYLRLDERGGCTVHIHSLAGGADRALAPCFYERLHQVLDWSADGRWLAIAQRDPGTDTVSIVLQPPDGGAPRRLTQTMDGTSEQPRRQLAAVVSGPGPWQLGPADPRRRSLRPARHSGRA